MEGNMLMSALIRILLTIVVTTQAAFAQERLAPESARWDREHHFPADAVEEMARLGFFGMLVPEQWDGNDSGYVSYAVALEEIAALVMDLDSDPSAPVLAEAAA